MIARQGGRKMKTGQLNRLTRAKKRLQRKRAVGIRIKVKKNKKMKEKIVKNLPELAANTEIWATNLRALIETMETKVMPKIERRPEGRIQFKPGIEPAKLETIGKVAKRFLKNYERLTKQKQLRKESVIITQEISLAAVEARRVLKGLEELKG